MVNRSYPRIGVHHIWFDLVWSVYLLIKLFQWAGLGLPELINSHLTDLLCIPVILGFSGEILIKVYGKGKAHLSLLQIVFATAYVSVFFEYVLPKFNVNATGDPLDVVCYGLGALAFTFIQGVSEPAKKRLNFLWR